MRMRNRTITALALLAACVLPHLHPIARAQESQQPLLMISVAPLDGVLKNTSYMLRACNIPEMSGLVTIMANQYSQGLDTTRPVGAIVTLEQGAPKPVVFLPAANVDQFFGALAGAGIEADDLGDGLFEVNTGRQILYARHSGNWLFITQTEEASSQVPADPERLLGDLPQRYDIAVRLNVQSLPPELKSMVVTQVRAGFEQSIAMQQNQDPQEAESARQIGEASLQQIEQLINDTEQVIIGWRIDQAGQKTYIDAAAQFVTGSSLANQVEQSRDLSSRYSSLILPDAAVYARSAAKIVSENDKQVAKNNLHNSFAQIKKQVESNAEIPSDIAEVITNFLDSVETITAKTIDEGVSDGVASMTVTDGTLRVLAGGMIADGNELARSLEKVMTKVASEAKGVQVEFNYGTHGDYQLHRIAVPLDSGDQRMRAIFGGQLLIGIASADKAFLLTLDPSGDALLKSAIDRLNGAQPQPATPFELVAHIQPLLQFANSVSPNPILEQAAQAAAQAQGNDKITVTARYINRGAVYRLSLDEGVLRTIGTAAKAGGGQQQGF
ncbi:MAG: hypothetical protein KatS3mg111_0397 [Pirellulaceae bacterium]|nr:MAG: hypothetical protein KatS3mg111_0397 [Pirellulaceae bacterium]